MTVHVVGVGAGLLAIVVFAACVPDDETANTLGTLVPPVTTAAPPTTVRQPATTAPTTTTAPIGTPTSIRQVPVADWTPGVRYDIGVIQRLTSVAGNPAIEFDRYSYSHPALGVVDAEQLDAEPIEYWYASSPFFNVRRVTRTFVLSPGVEILVLDDGERRQACSPTRSDSFPEPAWNPVDRSALDRLIGPRQLASLTYSSQGLVERIRFTHGC